MNAPVDISGIRLQSERLVLREWRLDDLDDLFEYASDPDVGPRAGWNPHPDKEESARILDRFIAGKKTFALVLKESGKVIGSLGIENYEMEEELSEFFPYRGRSIGYVLGKPFWGRGLMPEAVKAVVDYCFDELDYDFLVSGHFDFNDRSRRVQEKCGFRPYRKVVFDTPMGLKHPGVIMLLLNPKKDLKLDFSHPETLIWEK